MTSRYEGTVGRWTATKTGTMFSRSGEAMPARGRIVLLIHGLVVSSRYMVPLVRALAPRCRVYALDLPGYGLSYKPEGSPTIEELADSIARWMDAEGVEQASLIGNSLGCQILAGFCLRHPGRADRVVLQGPTVNPAERSFGIQLLRQIQNSPRERRGFTLGILMDYLDAGIPRAIRTMRMTLADAIEEKLPRMELPVLVLVGDRDPVVPLEWAREVAKLLPQGELAVVPGAAHLINWSFPVQFVEKVSGFLQI